MQELTFPEEQFNYEELIFFMEGQFDYLYIKNK